MTVALSCLTLFRILRISECKGNVYRRFFAQEMRKASHQRSGNPSLPLNRNVSVSNHLW